MVEKHYVLEAESQAKGKYLRFLAQDADTGVFCYANGELGKDEQNDEILRFVGTDRPSARGTRVRLKLTTYANLHKLNRMGMQFITLRRRSKNSLDATAQTPRWAWP